MSRAAEINYYEELGVAPDATPEQIRDAFRSLVRLLHPDQHPDQQLKDIAEAQMRKINRIYSVLSDAERRRRYDDALEEEDRAPTIVFSPARNLSISSKLLARLCWAGALLVVVGVLTWLGYDSPAILPVQSSDTPAGTTRPAAARAPGTENTDEVVQLRAELQTARAERDAALGELRRLRGPAAARAVPLPALAPSPEPANAASTPPPTAYTLTELPAPATRAAVAAALPQARTSAKPFAGFWFYTRPPRGQQNKNHALYPPEFIEASITEQNGVVHGRYRSRYQIVDRPISPDVNFEFNGPATPGAVKCSFSGPGGARGEITLTLTSENALSVEWIATELGSMQGLASGTAKLTRRLD